MSDFGKLSPATPDNCARPTGRPPPRAAALALLAATLLAGLGWTHPTQAAEPAPVPLPSATHPTAADPAPAPARALTLLFLGDSLTAGYGLESGQAYPDLIAARLQADGRGWRVVNAGLSGETSAGGRRRIGWLLRQPIDVLVLALGANDGLRGLPPIDTRDNLRDILRQVRERNPAVRLVVAGQLAPPNLGPDYTAAFASIFPQVARAEGAILIPFLLEGVAGDPSLNQADGIHPTAAGQRQLAETVWQTLAPILRHCEAAR